MFICECLYYIHQLHSDSLTQSVSTSVTTSHTKSTSSAFGHQQPFLFFVRSSTRVAVTITPGCRFGFADFWFVVCFGRIRDFVSSSAFYSFKTNFLAGWWVVGGGGGGSDVKMGCTIYWKFFSPTSYLQGCPSVNSLCNFHT